MPAWQAGIDAVGLLWERLKAGAQAAWQAIVAGVAATWDAIASAWSAGVDRVIGYLTRLRDFAVGVWNAIVDAAQTCIRRAAAGSRRGGRWRRRFCRGGAVFGRGTATSDSIPAWLSNGEFVVRAAAVRKYGLSLLHSLNRMRVDPGAFARFAEGGLVRPLQMLMPQPLRFAEGGLVPQPTVESLRPINLTIGADTFAGLLAPENVAQKLMQVAVSKQIRSAGRRPGYYGSGVRHDRRHLLTLGGIGVPAYSARGLTQSLEPIDAAVQLRRTVNGALADLSYEPFRKYKSTISCQDQEPPAVDGVWPGQLVEVGCVAELCFLTASGGPARPRSMGRSAWKARSLSIGRSSPCASPASRCRATNTGRP